MPAAAGWMLYLNHGALKKAAEFESAYGRDLVVTRSISKETPRKLVVERRDGSCAFLLHHDGEGKFDDVSIDALKAAGWRVIATLERDLPPLPTPRPFE